MKTTVVIPTYWSRESKVGYKESDVVYDHPTPISQEGTIKRVVESCEVLSDKNFNLVIIGSATTEEIAKEAEKKLESILSKYKIPVKTFIFSFSHLKKIYKFLEEKNKNNFINLLSLYGYSNVRNICLFTGHLLSSDIVILIDDDEVFEDNDFIKRGKEFIGKKIKGEKILGIAGYYINPDNSYLLNREIQPYMLYWNKISAMNSAFKKIIGTQPRLKKTPFAFGGNIVLHKDLFISVPFDPNITRGEDIDYLINAKIFGINFYLDNELSIKHLPPSKPHLEWKRIREDIYRFVYEREKVRCQNKFKLKELLPYPGEFLKDDLFEKIYKSNIMLAIDYLTKGDKESSCECLRNIYLANTEAVPKFNPVENLFKLKNDWEKLMEYFSNNKIRKEALELINWR